MFLRCAEKGGPRSARPCAPLCAPCPAFAGSAQTWERTRVTLRHPERPPRGFRAAAAAPCPGRVCPRCRRCFDDMLTVESVPPTARLSFAHRASDSVVDPDPGGSRDRGALHGAHRAWARARWVRSTERSSRRSVARWRSRSCGASALDETSRGRFLREAQANSLLASPNTVTVFDFGTGDTGEFYLAMEMLEGESLGQRLKRVGRLDAASALDVARQAPALTRRGPREGHHSSRSGSRTTSSSRASVRR